MRTAETRRASSRSHVPPAHGRVTDCTPWQQGVDAGLGAESTQSRDCWFGELRLPRGKAAPSLLAVPREERRACALSPALSGQHSPDTGPTEGSSCRAVEFLTLTSIPRCRAFLRGVVQAAVEDFIGSGPMGTAETCESKSLRVLWLTRQ